MDAVFNALGDMEINDIDEVETRFVINNAITGITASCAFLSRALASLPEPPVFNGFLELSWSKFVVFYVFMLYIVCDADGC